MNYAYCPIHIEFTTTRGNEYEFTAESYEAVRTLNSARGNPSYEIMDPVEALQTHFMFHRHMPLAVLLEFDEGVIMIDLTDVTLMKVRVLEPNA